MWDDSNKVMSLNCDGLQGLHLKGDLDEMKSLPDLAVIFEKVDQAAYGLGSTSLPM